MKPKLINSVKKVGESRFMLNDDVIVSDFKFEDDKVTYRLDYENVTLKEAQALVDEFIIGVLRTSVENNS